MSRSARRTAVALLGGLAGSLALGLTGAGAASSWQLRRPVASLARLHLDYETPLEYPGGSLALAAPLETGVVHAAEADFSYLHYETTGDLGGFEPAPVGKYLSGSTGRAVGRGPRIPHVPFLGKAGRGTKVYGFVGGGTTSTTSTTTTTTIAGPTTTVPVTPTTVPTTTIISPPAPLYIEMTNNHERRPVLVATNMEPGDTAAETVVIGNHGKVPFAVRLRSVGTHNELAKVLRLRVAVVGGDVLYSGPLDTSGVRIGHLGVGQSIDLRISLHLPRSAGNELQLKEVTLDLFWTGQG